MKARTAMASARNSGFTLIELVVVLGILVVVLTASYQLIVDCLQADRLVDKLTLPEKVGEGILSLFRQDVSGTVWKKLGTRVFQVLDSGEPPDAKDTIKLMSSIEPTPLEEVSMGTTVSVSQLRTITGIWYFLRPNDLTDGVATYTLFRKEIVDFGGDMPLESAGKNYEVYDKVAYLNILCYDGFYSSWERAWDSELRIQEEEAAAAEEEAANQRTGVARVVDRRNEKTAAAAGANPTGAPASKRPNPRDTRAARGSNALTQAAPGVDPTLGTQDTTPVPPAAVPTAVRIEVGIYVGQGGRIERDPQGNPILKVYSTIVPILTSLRVPIESTEDTEASGAEGVAGETGADGGTGEQAIRTSGGALPLGGAGGVPGGPTAGRGPTSTPGRGGRELRPAAFPSGKGGLQPIGGRTMAPPTPGRR